MNYRKKWRINSKIKQSLVSLNKIKINITIFTIDNKGKEQRED